MQSDNWIRVSDLLPQILEDFKAGRVHERTTDRMTFEDWEAQPEPQDDEGDEE